MPIDITMPALSPTMESGTLAKWHIKVGDTVKPGDVIAEIETDKATMEVESIDEGVVAEILVPEGAEDVKVNAVIARLRRAGRLLRLRRRLLHLLLLRLLPPQPPLLHRWRRRMCRTSR